MEYGLIRLYYNDFGDKFLAGDMVVKQEGKDNWEWVYLRHGDGPDTLTNPADDPDMIRSMPLIRRILLAIPTFMHSYDKVSWASVPGDGGPNASKRP